MLIWEHYHHPDILGGSMHTVVTPRAHPGACGDCVGVSTTVLFWSIKELTIGIYEFQEPGICCLPSFQGSLDVVCRNFASATVDNNATINWRLF